MKKIRLIIIGFLAIVSTILFCVFSFAFIEKIKNEKEKTFLVVTKEQLEKVSEEVIALIPPPKEETIEITTAGDCTLGADTNFGYSGQFDWWFKYKANGNYGYFFEKVKYLFENDDYSYVNLEGTLTKYNKKSEK